jgi:hypothetical protein
MLNRLSRLSAAALAIALTWFAAPVVQAASGDHMGGPNLPLAISGYYSYSLGRAPSQNEIDFWVEKMEAGWTGMDVQVAIANSKESWMRIIVSYYQSWIGRSPSPDEAGWWADRIVTGASSRFSVESDIYNSPEAQIHRAAKTDETFRSMVKGWYAKYLGREPEAEALTWRVGLLKGGYSPYEMERDIANSPEALAR